jgi:hypothetical protein
MQNVRDAIKVFEGLSPAKPASITSTKEAIYSYATCIATRQHVDGTGRVVINITKYSVTTSKLQNALRAEYPSAILVCIAGRNVTANDLRIIAARKAKEA